MIEQDMHALTVKVQAIGPAVFVGLSGWNIPKLAALEASFHTLKLAVAGSGAVVLQPALTHKVCRPNSAQTPLHRLPSRGSGHHRTVWVCFNRGQGRLVWAR